MIRPALPCRAGSASLVSLILMPKPGRRLSNASTRWPRGAGAANEEAVGEQSAIGHLGLAPGYDWATKSPRAQIHANACAQL